jgi:hypothetical protein
MTIFWDVARLVEVHQRFRSDYSLHHQGDVTWASFYQTLQSNIPEDSHLHNRRLQNLKYQEAEILTAFYLTIVE